MKYTNNVTKELWAFLCRQIELAKAAGLLDVLEGKLEGLYLRMHKVHATGVDVVPPPNQIFAFIDRPESIQPPVSDSSSSSTPPVKHPRTRPLRPEMAIHIIENRDAITEAINTLEFPVPATSTTTTASSNPSQKSTVKVSASSQVTMPAQHQDSSASASVAHEAQEVVTTTTHTTAEKATAMPGPDPSDPTAAAASSTTTPAPETKKSKKNKQKKQRRKDKKEKTRLEKLQVTEEPPVKDSHEIIAQASPQATASHGTLGQASPSRTVPPSRESSPGIRASLETSLLVPAVEVRAEGDVLEDVVAKRSTTPPTPIPAHTGPDEADPPSPLTTAAATTMAAKPPSPSSSVATEDRELWNPWWNLHHHGKTILSWQHEDGRLEPITLSALTRTNQTESECYFDPYCRQHTPKTLCWCPECRLVSRWCCCAHYTSYCTVDPRLQGGLIVASWPKQSASRAAPAGAEVCTSAAPAETTAMTVPGQHGLAAEETLFEGRKLPVQKAASEYDPSTDVSTPLFFSSPRPRTVVRRLSWPITFCSAEERYPM